MPAKKTVSVNNNPVENNSNVYSQALKEFANTISALESKTAKDGILTATIVVQVLGNRSTGSKYSCAVTLTDGSVYNIPRGYQPARGYKSKTDRDANNQEALYSNYAIDKARSGEVFMRDKEGGWKFPKRETAYRIGYLVTQIVTAFPLSSETCEKYLSLISLITASHEEGFKVILEYRPGINLMFDMSNLNGYSAYMAERLAEIAKLDVKSTNKRAVTIHSF